MIDSGVVYTASDLAGGGRKFRTLDPAARLSVFGDPIAHSASPRMQNAALRKGKKGCQYVRIRVAPDELQNALENLAEADFLGTNLTIPHKQEALPLLDEISSEARLMGAVNTVAVRKGKLHGHNTDGPGFAAAIQEEFGVELKNLRVLILGGGGGAGRAITVQCALVGCPSIFVANRTVEKAELLSEQIQETLGIFVTPISLVPEALANSIPCVDLIVNTTPLGMKGNDSSPLPGTAEKLLTRGHFIYDTVYGNQPSALLRQAGKAGLRNANGFSMLLHQGALAYEIWFNEPAPLETMRAALQEAITA